MKTISGLAGLREVLEGAVIVIGVFDGLHRGHRYLISQAVSRARRLKAKSVCVSFHPHPRGEPYLISLKHRLKIIEEYGVDYCLVIHFNKRFSLLGPEDFVRDILVRFFHPAFIFVGENFRFGHKARADVQALKELGARFGFKVKAIKRLNAGKEIISSKNIRRLIKDGDLFSARRLLGRRVSVLGTVIPGAKRGRILGYPTANINPHHEVLPKEGVYAVKIIYRGKRYNGLCNIGHRPTFHHNDDTDKTIEAHLFDFKKDLYGQDLEIQFVKRIREEKKFPSITSLVHQIQRDSQEALRLLRSIS